MRGDGGELFEFLVAAFELFDEVGVLAGLFQFDLLALVLGLQSPRLGFGGLELQLSGLSPPFGLSDLRSPVFLNDLIMAPGERQGR